MEINLENLYWDIGAKGLISLSLYNNVMPRDLPRNFMFPFREKEIFIINLSWSTCGIIDQFARSAP